MLTRQQNAEWRQLWDDRYDAVRRVLGETVPPGEVHSFSWKKFLLPGACALAFAPNLGRKSYFYMTLGLTQPFRSGVTVPEWEFAVKSNERAIWPVHILFDLLTYWLDRKPNISCGMRLPLAFFLDDDGALCAGLAKNPDGLNVVGSIRGLFLWNASERFRFKASNGEFSLMVAVAVTEDEIQLATETTPPHVLLLLDRMGIGQVSDPMRMSVMTIAGAQTEWVRIREMSHDQVIDDLGC